MPRVCLLKEKGMMAPITSKYCRHCCCCLEVVCGAVAFFFAVALLDSTMLCAVQLMDLASTKTYLSVENFVQSSIVSVGHDSFTLNTPEFPVIAMIFFSSQFSQLVDLSQECSWPLSDCCITKHWQSLIIVISVIDYIILAWLLKRLLGCMATLEAQCMSDNDLDCVCTQVYVCACTHVHNFELAMLRQQLKNFCH